MVRIKFTFSNGSAAWAAMHAMDAAGFQAGYPNVPGGYVGPKASTLLVDVPQDRKVAAVDVGFAAAAYGYTEVVS